MLDELQREQALVHLQRGLHLERAHRVHEAVEEYRRAIARDPHLPEAHSAIGRYYQRYGRLAKAAEAFRVVASLADDFPAHFHLACVMLELGRHEEALSIFQRCLVLAPEDPATHYEIARLLFLRGAYEDALAQLGRPLQVRPDDWDVQHLAGRCYLRLGRYDDAFAAFAQAAALAQSPATHAASRELIATAERYRELGTLRSLRDMLYAEHGVAYLGSTQDDGIDPPEYPNYHFTYPDIGVTLQRAYALLRLYDWQFTCVVALDRMARPVAEALAWMLHVPTCYADAIQPTDRALLVLGVGREAELLELALERSIGEVTSFCLGLNWLRHRTLMSDIVGVIVREACSVPWEAEIRRLRADGAPTAHVDACIQHAGEQIIAALQSIPAEDTLAHQVAYYAEHSRLHAAEAARVASDHFSNVVGK